MLISKTIEKLLAIQQSYGDLELKTFDTHYDDYVPIYDFEPENCDETVPMFVNVQF